MSIDESSKAPVSAGPVMRFVSKWLFWTIVTCALLILVGPAIRGFMLAKGTADLDERVYPFLLFTLMCLPAYLISSIMLSSRKAMEAAEKHNVLSDHASTIKTLTVILCLILGFYIFYATTQADYPAPNANEVPAAAEPLKQGDDPYAMPEKPWTLLQYVQAVSVPVSVVLIALLGMLNQMLPKSLPKH